MDWPVSWLTILIAGRLCGHARFVSQVELADGLDHLTSRDNIQRCLNHMHEHGMVERRPDANPIEVRLSPASRTAATTFFKELAVARRKR